MLWNNVKEIRHHRRGLLIYLNLMIRYSIFLKEETRSRRWCRHQRRARDSRKERFSSFARSGGFFFVGIGPVGGTSFPFELSVGFRFYSATILPLLHQTSTYWTRVDNGSLVHVKKSNAKTRNVRNEERRKEKEREVCYVLLGKIALTMREISSVIKK